MFMFSTLGFPSFRPNPPSLFLPAPKPLRFCGCLLLTLPSKPPNITNDPPPARSTRAPPRAHDHSLGHARYHTRCQSVMQGHAKGLAMLQAVAAEDASGSIAKAAAHLATPAGARDFLTFPFDVATRQAAEQVQSRR